MTRKIFSSLVALGLAVQAFADVGDPQIRNDQFWHLGELAISTFERPFLCIWRLQEAAVTAFEKYDYRAHFQHAGRPAIGQAFIVPLLQIAIAFGPCDEEESWIASGEEKPVE